ncbi:hypothetical protein GCK32_014128 [Trichostrongylus colubriformis]|uniref:Uncharacterized protein n=1 Tax=Trichostrongylus colubriformis TaxID=6319 RepID=A0AAN8IUL8_TRICO
MAEKKRAEGKKYQQEFQFLANLRSDTISELEQQRATNLDEIHQYLRKSRQLDDDWTHHLLSTTCAGLGGGELVLRINRLLRGASVIKERLRCLMQRATLFVSVHANMAGTSKTTGEEGKRPEQDKLDERVVDIIPAVVEQLRKLDGNISEMEYELNIAEEMVRSENLQKTDKPPNPLKGHVKVEQKVVKAEVPDEDSQSSKRKLPPSDDDGSRKVKVLSDDEYLSHLIRENSEVDASDGKKETKQPEATRKEGKKPESHEAEKKTSQERHPERKEERSGRQPRIKSKVVRPETDSAKLKKDRMEKLQKDLCELQYGLQLLPRRKITDSTTLIDPAIICVFCNRAGVHFSDSCPVITNGDERYGTEGTTVPFVMFLIPEGECEIVSMR